MRTEPAPPVSRLLDFAGKIALVTGASGGIGRGIAERFAAAGASVAVHYREGRTKAEAAAEAIRQMGRQALAIQANVTRPDEVERLIGQTSEVLGGIDVVVNNAGVYPLGSLVGMTAEAWSEVIETNLTGVHLVTRAAAKQMTSRHAKGVILNIASIEGLRPAPEHGHYGAAKAGVLAHTRSAALELGPYGIRVNAVSPGLIAREGIEEDWPEGVQSFVSRAPLGRLGTPEDVADACLFLASDGARFITGANLVVDGGVLLAAAF